MVDAYYFDIETCSAADLRKVGAFVYARHPTTDIRCLSYCLVRDGKRGPILTWFPGDPIPPTVFEIVDDSIPLIAFNIAFDGQIWEAILTPRYGWPKIAHERYRCAQAAALTRALPASLDAAAAALGIPTRKSDEGIAAMLELARPRRQSKKERLAGVPLDFNAAPEKLAILAEYNRDDVTMTMDVVDLIGLILPTEQAIWQLDQQINRRGVHVDLAFIEAALCIEDAAQRDTQNKIAELTDGKITTAKQRDRILKWLLEHDCELTDLRHGTVVAALADPKLTAPARQLLELRHGGAGAAALKFKALQRWANGEDEPRIRYAYRYHGGSAGRFTSLGVQLHNLRKPEIEDTASAIAAVSTGSFGEMRRRGFTRPLETIGHVTRASIRAAPGKRLFIADLSSIEARGAALIVGRTAELKQWREFDRSGRPETEPYYLTGVKTFHQPPEKARKVGKVGRLAFQYQGGVGAYRRVTGDQESSDEFVAQHRDRWRADHGEFVQFWHTSIFQAVQAIQYPGKEFTLGLISFRFDPETRFLELTLPSGRKLAYPKAEVIVDEQFDSASFTFLDASGSRTGRMYHERRGSGAFGGLLLENVTQALCRDVFVEAMPRLEAAGYAIVMHTHDEFVCEVPESSGSLEEFLALIIQPPMWAPDLPIAAKARISDRLIEITTATKVEDNAIDNSAIVETENEDADEGDENDAAPPPVPPWESETMHICAQCQHNPPDGSEHEIGGVWLHVDCEELFIRARMADQGIAWTETSPSSSPPPPPPSPPFPPTSNGRGNRQTPDGFDDFTTAPVPASAPRPSGNGYPHGETAASPSNPAVDEYIYKNAAGRLHMRVLRTASKNFPTFFWGDGGWISGWPKEVIPYRLNELLAAPPDMLTLICEGERDTDIAVRYGFVATTNPGGAKCWQPELAQYFKGKQRVIIIEDNDAAGTEHTTMILKALHNVVPTIGVLRFSELGPGGDLTDYFEDGGSKAYLLTRIETALKAKAAQPYVITCIDDVATRPVEWLWPGHLATGGLELMTGAPELGKSQIQLAYAAAVTTTQPWPDGSPSGPPRNVILVTAEDQLEDTIRPRAEAAGVDLTRLHVLRAIKRNNREEMFLLSSDLEILEQAIRDLGDVGLILIDPITAYMGRPTSGKFDSHRATDVRSVLSPLKDLAGRCYVAISAITHPPKGNKTSALDSFIGSQAYIAAARIAHVCIAEVEPGIAGAPRKTGRMFYTQIKLNIGARAGSLAYRIETRAVATNPLNGLPIMAPFIAWEGPVELTSEEALALTREVAKRKANPAAEFLMDLLTAAGAPVLQRIIVERGATHGFSLDQLKRAKKQLGVVTFRRKGEGPHPPWFWSLSQQHLPADAETESA